MRSILFITYLLASTLTLHAIPAQTASPGKNRATIAQSSGSNQGGFPNKLIAEREYNDSGGYADDLGRLTTSGQQVSGSLLGSADADTFKIQTSVDGSVSLRLRGNGNPALAAATLQIQSTTGTLISEFDAPSLPSGSIQLPAGRYRIAVLGTNSSGGYLLDLGLTKLQIPNLSPSQSKTLVLSSAYQLARLIVPAEGHVRITISGGQLDSYLELYNANMDFMIDVDDDSRSSNSDAGLNAHLPAGIYHLLLATWGNSGNANIRYSFQAGPIPNLACNKNLNGQIPGGEEDLVLYRLQLASPQEMVISLQPRGASGISDSYLLLYDARGSLILESDDDANAVGSIISGTFPAGTFYAASSGYWATGNYSISNRCGAPVLTRAVPGKTSSSIKNIDGNVTFEFSFRTPVPAEAVVIEGTLPDAHMAVLDTTTGLLAGYNDDDFISGGAMVSTTLSNRRYFAIVKDYDGATGSLDFELWPPLLRDTSNNIIGLGKTGDHVVLLAAVRSSPPIAIIPAIKGYLLLSLNPGVALPARQVTGDGSIAHGFKIPPGLFPIQTVAVNVSAMLGAFGNELK